MVTELYFYWPLSANEKSPRSSLPPMRSCGAVVHPVTAPRPLKRARPRPQALLPAPGAVPASALRAARLPCRGTGPCHPRALSARLPSAAATTLGQSCPRPHCPRDSTVVCIAHGSKRKPPHQWQSSPRSQGLLGWEPAEELSLTRSQPKPVQQTAEGAPEPQGAGLEGETTGNLMEKGTQFQQQGHYAASLCFFTLLVAAAGLDTLPSVRVSLFSLKRTKESLKALKQNHTRFHFSSYFAFQFSSYFGFHFSSYFYGI